MELVDPAWVVHASSARARLRQGPGPARLHPGHVTSASRAARLRSCLAPAAILLARSTPARSRCKSFRRSARPAEDTDAVQSCKRELLCLAAAGNRFSASLADRKRAGELVDTLALDFRAAPDISMRRDLLRGRWKLVYTSSPDLTSLSTLPLGWQTDRVGQSFLTASFARNKIDFLSPLGSKVSQEVNCTWRIVTPMDDSFLVELVFRYSTTRLEEVAGLQLTVPALNLPLPPGAGVFEASLSCCAVDCAVE